ncbi:MAG TPA: helix-turn-helix domain-containing protein [Ktedonobacteraceae bacterium]|nr:helix-turn-helix domain-containing protein [Ktedonobacteraceae bacterium]
MSAQRQSQTPLSLELHAYLKAKNVRQQELADLLNVDVRTLRRWLSGQTIIADVRELRRIADILQVAPERLGVTSSLHVPLTPEQIDDATKHTWKHVRAGKYYEANVLADKLIIDIANFPQSTNTIFLRRLASAHYVAGFVKSQISRMNEVHTAIFHYHEMEQIARLLGDQNLINIALTYQGDMLQRRGDVADAIAYLEAARDTTPLADISAKGNGIQLLGRAYFKARRLGDFERAMKESEDMALELEEISSGQTTKGQFNVGTVYEEYGRSVGLLGQTKEGMDYLSRAEQAFKKTWTAQRRDLLLTSSQAIVLVHGGEIRQGVTKAIECIDLVKRSGNLRMMDRIYGVQQYIDRLSHEIGSAGMMLREALTGPIEY